MSYLLDTCVVSELTKKQPDPCVIAWVEAQVESSLYLSVLTLGELQRGVSRLKDHDRSATLQAWIDQDLAHRFVNRILPIDYEVASYWGRLSGELARQGVVLPVTDSLIAASAYIHHLIIVTRNVRDFGRCRVEVVNPWP